MTTEIVALSSDDPSDLQMMVDRVAEENDGLMLDNTFLSDPGAGVINRYGLFNQDDPRGRAIPHPTTYVIDRDGAVDLVLTSNIGPTCILRGTPSGRAWLEVKMVPLY